VHACVSTLSAGMHRTRGVLAALHRWGMRTRPRSRLHDVLGAGV
jgi:hypothetical protein